MTIRTATAFVLTLLLAGCSLFSRSQSRFFSLEPVPSTAAVASTRPIPAGIDSIELPPGFDRREIVVVKQDHQLEVRSTEQWSASLQPLVLHTLAFDLASRLPDGAVVLPGAVRPATAMRSIDVVFGTLAAGPESAVTLDARWTLREPGRPDLAHHEQIRVDIASLASQEVAGGTSRALATLADRIAAAMNAP